MLIQIAKIVLLPPKELTKSSPFTSCLILCLLQLLPNKSKVFFVVGWAKEGPGMIHENLISLTSRLAVSPLDPVRVGAGRGPILTLVLR